MINSLSFNLTKARTIFFVFAFTALSVITPIIFHFFGGANAGRTFLPIQFFVFAAALTLGWQEGLAVGILTPLVSYFVSGMPALAMLPIILAELMIYGLAAGYLQEKFKNIWISLFGAIVFGRLILAIFAGQYVWGAVQAGWMGILVQITLVPLFVKISQKLLNERI